MEDLVNKNFWQDRKVFITGASGLLGGWLADALVKLNASVIILLRDWVPQSILNKNDLWQNMTVVRGDLSDTNVLQSILAEYEIKTVFHLAAQTIVPIANKNPLSTFNSNIAGTWNLLEAARLCKRTISEIIVASTDKSYGEIENLPYQEDMLLNPKHPYDVSKACAELIAKCYALTWDMPIAITRCGNFFGGGDLNWNRIIPGTIRNLLRDKPPVIRSNGQFIRDYLYVDDAVLAYLLLAESLSNDQKLSGQAFNFSLETPVSVAELVKTISELMSKNIPPTILNETSNEIPIQYLDASKAKSYIGWSARYDLHTGLRNTISWYKDFLKI